MKIVNSKNTNTKEGIYIGRGSPLGNPFPIGEAGDRQEVIQKYKAYLYKELENQNPVILAAMAALNEQSILACFCAPQACHGDVIAEIYPSLSDYLPKPQGLFYAGIGARKTPPEILDKMKRVATRLEALGFTLRSGGADGADSAFESGTQNKHVFLPWQGFNHVESPRYGVSTEALNVAYAVHPGELKKMKQGIQSLMARNGYQILGDDLRSPSQFVVCWTEDGCETESQRTRSTGGTGQAIALASRFERPVFNLKHPDALLRLGDYLKTLTLNKGLKPR